MSGEKLALKRTNIMPQNVQDLKTGGKLIRPVTASRVEYIVNCGPGDDRKIAFADLKLPEGTPVVCRDLSSNPELNGRCGVVQKFDESSERYLVAMSFGQILKMKPERLYV